jgi:ubiquinone/menaquinone biosynthesis C-methylase UbiE
MSEEMMLNEKTIYERFKGLSDQEWFDLNTDDYEADESVRRILPGFPSDEIQMRFNGKTGKNNLFQAFAFYNFTKKIMHLHHPVSEGAILDFGCGWGRILRFWLKDFPGEKIYGSDIMQLSLDLCQDAFGDATKVKIVKNLALPPIEMADSQMRLIYAHSVFSHLSQVAADAWINEFHRLLEPKGLVVITTRPRDFVHNPGAGGNRYQGSTEWKKLYMKGEFCFEPQSGQNELEAKYYGEASFSRRYVEKNWNQFVIKEFVPANRIQHLNQDIFVLQKKTEVFQKTIH